MTSEARERLSSAGRINGMRATVGRRAANRESLSLFEVLVAQGCATMAAHPYRRAGSAGAPADEAVHSFSPPGVWSYALRRFRLRAPGMGVGLTTGTLWSLSSKHPSHWPAA